jgi:hypothetical protein
MRSLSLNPGFPMGSKDIRNGGQVVKLPDYGRGGLSVPGYAGCTGTRTRRRLYGHMGSRASHLLLYQQSETTFLSMSASSYFDVPESGGWIPNIVRLFRSNLRGSGAGRD